jgi:hypothetical protein
MRKDQLARTRALARLSRKYPTVFRKFLNEERQELDLPPVGVLHPGPLSNAEKAEASA